MTSHGPIATNTGAASMSANAGEPSLRSAQAQADALDGSATSIDAPSAAVTSGSNLRAVATPASVDRDRAAVRYLIFWRDGFQLGRGTPLRSYDDPAQAAILSQINAGVPPAALGVQPGELVELRVEKRIDRDYTPGEEIEVPATEESAPPTAPQITNGEKEKSSAVVESNRLRTEKSTKSEYIQPTKERREQGGGAQEEKSNLLDKIVGCIRICL